MTAPPPAHPTRLAFLGTPALAAPFLIALVEAGHKIALVITGEDRRRGRREEPSPSPVKAAANDRSDARRVGKECRSRWAPAP